MIVTSPERAFDFFTAKLEFTTGPIELDRMIKTREDIRIIDVRAFEDYRRGHIPNAENLPRDRWDSLVGLSRDVTNIVYCYSEVCHLAAEAARFFAENGYPVMELQGGFDQWTHHGLAVES